MAQNITLMGASFENVPGVKLPKTGGGEAAFFDVSATTATAATVQAGETFILADGSQGTGSLVIQHYYTGSGEPPASLGEDGDIYLEVVS